MFAPSSLQLLEVAAATVEWMVAGEEDAEE